MTNLNYQLIKKEIDKIDNKFANEVKANTEGKKFSLLVLKKLSGYRRKKLCKFYSDGSGDHQIDAVYFYEGKDELIINIITCYLASKPQTTFSSKDITDFINIGLKYILFGGDEPPDANDKIKGIKAEIDEQKEVYEHNYSVNIKFVSSADKVLDDNSRKQILKFQNEITSSGVELSYDEINGQNMAAMFSSRVVLTTPIPIKLSGRSYYLLVGKEGFVCRLPVKELIKMYFGSNENGRDYKGYGDYLFTDNIRKNLGIEKKINQNIYDTAINEISSDNFEYFNNGLTIIYDGISGSVAGDSPSICLKGLQIVNGCQTVHALIKAHNDKKLSDNIYITCRFIKRIADEKFIQSVITYTNSQNAISERDLHANDPVQYNIQTILKNHDILYERKLNEFKDINDKDKFIVDAVDAAQAYLCCELKSPHKAKQKKKKLFGVLYEEVFDQNKSDLAHKMFISYLVLDDILAKQAELRRKKQKTKREGRTPKYKLEDIIVAHGSYHIAAKLYQKWFGMSSNLERFIKGKKMPRNANADYNKAIQEILAIVKSEKVEKVDLPKYFKSKSLLE